MLTKADQERLKELTPEMVERWLKANGWESLGGSVLIFEIWTHPEHGMLNLHGLMIVPDLAKKEADLYSPVSALGNLAERLDRYPHEILAEMLQPGCVVEAPGNKG